MRLQHDCQSMDGGQQPIGQSRAIHRHDCQMDLTPLKTSALLRVASLYQLHVNAGVIAPMTRQKWSDQIGDDLWGRADFECPGLSAAQRLSMFGQKL